jgi:predicted RNase H-like HicB family nuclease
MAKSVDDLVRRTTTKENHTKASRRAQELLAELVLGEHNEFMQKTKIKIKKPSAPQKSAFTAILYREDDGYVATCPELDVASQGMTVEEATANLTEAVELFLECADPKEIDERLLPDILVTRIEARHG